MNCVLYASTLLVLSAHIIPASSPGAFDRTLPVSGPVFVEARSDPGGVVITTAKNGSVRVHAILKPLYGRLDLGLAEANIRELERNPPIEQNGDHIRIGYIRPTLLSGVSMRLEIEVPRETLAVAQTTSGGIRIDGINGPATSQTSSGRTEISNIGNEVMVTSHSGLIFIHGVEGRVSVRNESGGIQMLSIRGPAELQTTSGRTEVSDISGDIRATTHSGSIRIDNAKAAVVAMNSSGSIDGDQLAGPVHAETTSGAIRIAQLIPAPIRARTDSGAIKVDLASRGGYLIDAQSQSGRVSGPTTGLRDIAEPHRLKEKLGSGGPVIDLDTRSSRIEIN